MTSQMGDRFGNYGWQRFGGLETFFEVPEGNTTFKSLSIGNLKKFSAAPGSFISIGGLEMCHLGYLEELKVPDVVENGHNVLIMANEQSFQGTRIFRYPDIPKVFLRNSVFMRQHIHYKYNEPHF